MLVVLAASGAAAQPARAPARATRAETRAYAQQIMQRAFGDMAALQQCYSAAPEDLERTGRRLRAVTVIVQPDGSISDVSIAPRGAAGAALRACVVGVARRWRLTPPRDGQRALRVVFDRRQIAGLTGE